MKLGIDLYLDWFSGERADLLTTKGIGLYGWGVNRSTGKRPNPLENWIPPFNVRPTIDVHSTRGRHDTEMLNEVVIYKVRSDNVGT